jgi:hypothetical protein
LHSLTTKKGKIKKSWGWLSESEKGIKVKKSEKGRGGNPGTRKKFFEFDT